VEQVLFKCLSISLMFKLPPVYKLCLSCSMFLLASFLCACGNDTAQTQDKPITDTIAEIAYEVPEDNPLPYDMDATDTIMVNGYLLYFAPSEKITFPDYYPEQAARDSIDTAYDNSHDQAIAIEEYLKNIYGRIFTANDSILTITLANHKRISLSKMCENPDEEAYNFDHYFPETDYVLLHVQYYEGDAYTLVNRKNGFKRLIYGRPYFSPDKTAFITTSIDLETGYNYNGIEYYLLQGDTITKQFELAMSRCGPLQVKWVADNTIAIEKECWVNEGDTAVSFKAEYGLMTIKR